MPKGKIDPANIPDDGLTNQKPGTLVKKPFSNA